MAYQGSTNNVYTYGSADYCYAIKDALIAAGWQLVASGGGTGGSFSTSVDMVPTLASNVDGTYGRLGWNNSGAWAQLREPLNGVNPRREYVFMRGSATNTMIIKYSRQTGFTGGAAATLPTTGAGTPPPGDGVVVWASSNLGYSATVNNDAAITAATSGLAVTGTPTTGYVSCIASDVAVNGVFGFWMIAYNAGTGQVLQIIMSEAMSASSTPTQDQDPSIRQVSGTNFWNTNSLNTQNAPAYWQAYGLPTKAYVISAAGYGGITSINSGEITNGANLIPSTASSLNPYNSKINVYPMFVFPASATYGYQPKGFTSGLGWFNVTQNQLDTFNLTTTEPRIVIVARVVMPWKQNVIPLV